MAEYHPQHDALTGAIARSELAHLGENLAVQGEKFAVLLIDMDYFKSINDAFGHGCGDTVLAEACGRIRPLIGHGGVLVRYGGDEFVVLLPNVDRQGAKDLAERLIAVTSEKPLLENPPVKLSLSIGIAVYPEDGAELTELLARADERLYSSKRRGRGLSTPENLTNLQDAGLESLSLIERDAALAHAYELLRTLQDRSPGQLRISSATGVGRSRLLAQVGRVAALFGYGVLSVKAQPALRFRPGEALRRAHIDWNGPAYSQGAVSSWTRDLCASLHAANRRGLIVTVDDIAELDATSGQALRELFFSSELPPVGLVYTLGASENDRQSLLASMSGVVDVRLDPLSREGCRILLRELLRWEPPDAFLDVVYEVTQGRPGWIERGLNRLRNKGLLSQAGSVWQGDATQAEAELRQELALELTPTVHTLPRPITRFVGREEEIQTVKQLLEESRLVTLMGPGGTGKSRLALQVAHEQAYRYPGGAHFVSLAPVQSTELLPHAIASVFRLRVADSHAMIDQLKNSLGSHETLLVLDNMEHLLDGVPLLVELLSQIPQLQVLVTSRERLGIQGEVVQELAGLSVPSGLSDPKRLGTGAIQLFLDRARVISPGYVPGEDDWQAAVRICRGVQGSPLGIELAAAQTRLLSWTQVADGLAKSLDFLSGHYRDLPERHRSLRAAFLHSWQTLTALEQRSFSRLTIFRGPFNQEAAEAVTETSLPILAALGDKSLVRRLKDGRYEVHSLLRQFAAEQLGRDYDSVALRHAEYFLGQAEERDQLLGKGGERAAIFDWYEAEHENLRLAMRWCLDAGQAGLGVRFAVAMWYFWTGRGYAAEGRYWSEAILAAIPVDSPLNVTAAKARIHHGVGMLASEQGRPQEALVHGLAALDIQRKLGARRDVGGTMNTLGITYFRLGEYWTAIHYFEQSLEIARETKEPLRIAITLNSLGSALMQVGDLDAAQAALQEGLAIMREANPESLAVFTINLAHVSWMRGDYQAARRLSEETLDVARRVGRHPQIISALYWLGRCDLAEGDPAQAEARFLEGMEIANERGYSKDVSSMLIGLAGVAMVRGGAERAAWLLGYTERLIQQERTVTNPSAQKHYAELEEACRGHLTEASFNRAWNEAGAMSPQSAAAFALNHD